MNRLNEYDENIVYEIMGNKDNLDELLKKKFKAVERDTIEDDRLRKSIGRLIRMNFITGVWADNRLVSPMPLSALHDYILEYPKLSELTKEKVIEIVREAGQEYGIDNILIYSIPSCGHHQIGWEQKDAYEWRIKVESFEYVQLNNTVRLIIQRFNNLGYDILLDETNDNKPRIKRYLIFTHKSLIKNEIEDISYGFCDVFDGILSASISAQAFNSIKQLDENDINTYYRELLKQQGFEVSDQTLRGQSSTGISSGELDIFIENKDKSPLTVIEALKLTSVDSANIIKHINKIFGYDTAGLKENIVLIYAYPSDFSSFCNKYKNFIVSEKFKYDLYNVTYMPFDRISEIKMIESSYERSGMKRKLYHIIVNFSA